MHNDLSGPAGEAMPVPDRRASAALNVTIPAATDRLVDHLDNCRDLAELLIMAASDLQPHKRTPLAAGLVELSSRLSRAIETLQEVGK